LAAPAAWAQAERIGVLMLHGKNPGSAQNPTLRALMARLEREDMVVALPEMPWSRIRYLDGNWDGAMQEMERHVAALRGKGATQIVLMGHSMGAPAALSYAARKQDVHALVLFAPGHIPRGYYEFPALAAVRKSIDEARAMVAEGKGQERASFMDINQGKPQSVSMPAKDYLSFFDPQSDADMGVTAPRVPAGIPVLTVIGDADPLFRTARSYFHDRLPANPKTRYLEVSANHLNTPEVARDQAIAWIREALAKP
jgi:pimeloyl-ACP methyl ester carboxylesterase